MQVPDGGASYGFGDHGGQGAFREMMFIWFVPVRGALA